MTNEAEEMEVILKVKKDSLMTNEAEETETLLKAKKGH